MKDAVKGIANKFTDALDLRERWHHQQMFQAAKAISDAIRTLSVLRRDVEDARELVKGVHVVEGIGPTSALSEASKCLGLKWNLKDCQLDLTGGKLNDGDKGKSSENGKVEEMEKDDKEEEENEKTNEEKDEIGKEPHAELSAEDKEKTEKDKKLEVRGNEIDELENLTEEERRKRRKILRLKEKLAAASASSENKEVPRDKDKGDLRHKDKRCTKEKGEKEAETKEKENDPEAKTVTASSPPREAPGKDGHANPKPEGEAAAEGDALRRPVGERVEEPNKLCPEPSFLAKIEPLPKSKPDAASALKKPRGHSSRNSLKKSKTVTFMCPPEDTAFEDATLDDTSENIKGLDLETSRLIQGDKDNKEKEAGTGGEAEREERQNKRKDDSKKNKKKQMFEMEPEEKERIATELLQVGGWEYTRVHRACVSVGHSPMDKVSILFFPSSYPTALLYMLSMCEGGRSNDGEAQ